MFQKQKLVSLLLCLVLVASLFGVVGCGGGDEADESKGEVIIASKQFAESLILSHMAAILIEEKTDLKADISKLGMGATELLHPALAEGEIDLYPEYTNTAWMVVLEGDPIYDRQECYEKVESAYQEKFNLTCLEPFGFDNTFVVAVLQDVAKDLNLKTIGDLADHPELSFIGDSTTFTRPDVYLGLQETYGLDLKQVVVDTTFFYEALNQREGDVIAYFATDGQSKKYDLFTLEDDKHFFPPYDGMYVIRNEVLEQYPEIKDALTPLAGMLDDATMVGLNYEVEVENRDAADVAEEFLKSKGLI